MNARTQRLGEPGAIGMVVLDPRPVNVVPSPPLGDTMSAKFAVKDWRTNELIATYRDHARAKRFVSSQISVGAENGPHLFITPVEEPRDGR